jgi:GT2 family glycosyltransferase
MNVTAVVVNYNGGAMVEECLERLSSARGDLEIVVVDNASSDGSRERIAARFRELLLLASPVNLGFAAGNNLGARAATGDLLVLVNPDAFVTEGWLEPLVRAFDDPAVAIVSPKIYRGRFEESRRFDSAGNDLEFPLGEGAPRGYLRDDDGSFDEPGEVAYAAGAAFAVRRSVFEALGGFDEEFFAYFEEADFCWRARLRGYRVWYEPRALVYHFGGGTFGAFSPAKIYLQTRNRIATSVQNLALPNLLRFVAAEIVHGSAVVLAAPFFPKYRALGFAYARGWADAVRSLPRIRAKRALRQRERTVDDREILRLHARVGIGRVLLRYATMASRGADSVMNPTLARSAS